MKFFFVFLFLVVSLMSCASCFKTSSPSDSSNNINPNGSKMKLKIGNSTFSVTLYDNATVTAFKSLLPLTVNMVELNGNENMVIYPKTFRQMHLIPELSGTVT